MKPSLSDKAMSIFVPSSKWPSFGFKSDRNLLRGQNTKDKIRDYMYLNLNWMIKIIWINSISVTLKIGSNNDWGNLEISIRMPEANMVAAVTPYHNSGLSQN